MITSYSAKALNFSPDHALKLKKIILALFCTVLSIFVTFFSHAQGIVINPRSSMVMNGNVVLVVNNASLNNNGDFKASTSTVKFSGENDTATSYVGGNNTTTFHNLSVIKSANGVALKSSVGVKNVLNVSGGNFYTDSNLTLISDESLTARVDVVPSESHIYGKTNVERYIPARRAWRLMTAPVTSSNTIYNSWQNKGVYTVGAGLLVTGPNPTAAAGNGLDYSSQNTISMKGFNYNTQGFANVTNTKVAISAGNSGRADNTGYFVFVRGDRNPANTNVSNVNTTTITSIGTLQTGKQTFPASPVSGKYTLVGNPYASPVDFNKVTRTNLIKRIYVWDPSLNSVGGYVMLDDLDNDGVFAKSVAGSAQTKDIQSSQAFFVQTSTSAEAAITFNETSKSGNNNNLMFRPVTPGTTAGVGTGQIITTLNLLNSDKTILADGVIAEFDNIYSAGVDLDDAAKFSNTNENISIVRNNTTLAAERRPAVSMNDTLYFRLTTTTQRNYQFVFEAQGLEQPGVMGFLEDSYLGTSTLVNLSGITRVNFSINAQAASAAINRFRIVFKPVMAVLPVTFSSVKAYEKGNNIQVEWKVENEINMVKYDVEKSIDGTVFTKVATVNVLGTNNVSNNYSWLDVKAAQGNNFYRIRSYDKNGETHYTTIVKVAISKATGGISIYPNPITGNTINLQINDQPAGKYGVRITNLAGQTVYTNTIKNNGGNNTQVLNTGSKLPSGIYQLEMIGQDNNHYTQSVIVQ